MHRAKRPYWLGSLDRWNVLVVGILVVLLIVLNAKGFSRAPQVAAPALPPPVAGTALLAGQPGIITGTASPDAQVRVLDGDVPLGETTADASGAWRIAVPALSPGTHTLISQELDANGNVVATSEPLTVTVSEPTSIAGKAPEIKLPAAGLKADTPLTLEGTGTPGTTVQVYDGDQVVGETVVAPDGTWQITLPPLALGAHNLVAKLLGADGKEQSASAPVELTVADGQIVVATPATVAEATAVAAPTAGKAPEIKLPAAATLKAGEPIELEGTGEPGTTVTLYDGDQVVAETVVAPDGTWTLTVPPLAAGTHNLVAKQVGGDGKEQAASTPIELTVADGQVVVTTPAPSAAATTAPGAGAPAIKLPAAGLRASEPLTLEGTGTPGSTVTVYDGDEVVGETTVAPDGTWQITLPPPAAGAHSLVAKQVGADGKQQPASAPVELTVADGQIVVATPAAIAEATAVPGAGATDVVAPVAGKAPEIKRPAAAALKVGEPVVLEGTGEPGTTVTLYDGDQVVAETVVAPDGTWTITVPPLAAGTHSLAAKLLGAGGQEQAASAPIELTVADGKIVVATPAAVAQATAATGTATPVPGGTAAATVEPTSATAAGAATATPTVAVATTTEPTTAALAGAATAVATAATGLPSTAATPAVSAPMVATPVGAAENAGATMTLEGTGAPGTTVKVYDGDNLLGEATVGADGKWTMTMPTLAAGLHSLVAKLFGADGKEQATSPELSVTVSADPAQSCLCCQ